MWLHGEGFPTPETSAGLVTIGGVPARIAFASAESNGRRGASRHRERRSGGQGGTVPGTTLYAQVGGRLATGLHESTTRCFVPTARWMWTYSGTRGQEPTVSIFRISQDGAREAYVFGMVNPTSMAMDPNGWLCVSSRFEGRVYRVLEDRRYETVGTDMGVACGLAFNAAGDLFVGDRDGTIFKVQPNGFMDTFARIPPSIVAFHLAMGPDGWLYVSAPTLATYDSLWRVDPIGYVEPFDVPFGRPQGLAFDPSGVLHVVEAVAGSSGVYAVRPDRSRELVVSGGALIGLAFGPQGQLVVASNDSVYGFPAPPS